MQYKIQYLPIGKLVLNPDNPRLIRDGNFKRLVKSLKDCPSLFDARPCICSDRTGKNVILGGNMRYLAAKELKYKEVPVIIMSGLTPDQEREIVVKDNGDGFGEWNTELLSAWDDLPLIDWGIKIPQSWTAPQEEQKESDGTMRSVMNSGKGEGQANEGGETSEHFPVTFILDQPEYELWVAIKGRMKLKDDKKAFLKVIGGKSNA